MLYDGYYFCFGLWATKLKTTWTWSQREIQNVNID